jgi:O-antigen ligase
MYDTSGEVDPGRHAPVLPAGTHNIFLDLALGAGIPAAAAFIWLLWRILVTALRNFRNSSLVVSKAVTLGVAAGVIGMAVRLSFDQMLIGTLALQFWIWVALCVSMHSPSESDQPASILKR